MRLSILIPILFLWQFTPSFGQKSADEICPLLIGSDVPNVEVTDTASQPVNLSKLTKRGDYVIVFFRGGWCPYCNRQLSGLAEKEAEIKEAGFEIIAISTDDVSHSVETIADIEMNYKVLSDNDMKAAEAFGIDFKVDEKTVKRYETFGLDIEDASGRTHHRLPVPSVFVVQNGTITWSYVNPNYKDRVDEEVLIAVINNL